MYKAAHEVSSCSLWSTPSEHSDIYAALMGHHHLEHEVAVQQQMHKAGMAVQQQIYYETRAEELLYSVLNAMLNNVSYHNESAEEVLRDAVATQASCARFKEQPYREINAIEKCIACTICSMNPPSVRPSAPHPPAAVWILYFPWP